MAVVERGEKRVMKVGYLITARLKSTRLPKKIIREVKGKPIISHMLDRLKMAKKVDVIVICTSTNHQDDPLVEIARTNDVECYRGDPDDVLARLWGAAEEYKLDYVLNITADCPFVDPEYIDRIIDAFIDTDADFIRCLDLAHGAFSYGICPEALKKIIEIKTDIDTEVWGRYFTDTDLFEVYDLPIDNPKHRRPGLRMTLDYPEDLKFFETVFDYLYEEGKVFSLDDILDLLDRHPEIVEINSHMRAQSQKRMMGQSEIRLKPRYDVAKAAVIGCGSIGRRHIQNLQKLGITDIVALRTGMGHFKKLPSNLNVLEVDDWDDLFSQQPDIAIISNPTGFHLETAKRLLGRVKGIFIEKPLSSSLDGIKELLEEFNAKKMISFVGYNLQFHPAVLAIKEILNKNDIGKPIVFQCQVGNWLPDWHPYEDYKEAYYSRRDLGGGVALTLIHEIHLAQELLGTVEGVYGLFPKTEALPIEVDIIADLTTRHKSGAIGQIHLDFIQRPLHRFGVLSYERGWVRYDLANRKVVTQLADDNSPRTVWDEPNYDENEQYINEMETFISYVKEGRMRHEYDAWRAVQSLAVVDAAFNSAENGQEVKLPEWVLEIG